MCLFVCMFVHTIYMCALFLFMNEFFNAKFNFVKAVICLKSILPIRSVYIVFLFGFISWFQCFKTCSNLLWLQCLVCFFIFLWLNLFFRFVYECLVVVYFFFVLFCVRLAGLMCVCDQQFLLLTIIIIYYYFFFFIPESST